MNTSMEIFLNENSSNDNVLNFKVEESEEYEKIEILSKNIKIMSKEIPNYEKYNQEIDHLFSKVRIGTSELDYRYFEKCREKRLLYNKKAKDYEKMKLIGKIGNSPTIFDKNLFFGASKLSFFGKKIESGNSFMSWRANNCVTSGKWCYEVQLITNGLLQVGWCQIITPFTDNEGIGDDKTSFAFDGWRRVKWNGVKMKYGDLWDCGEYIGCCIDIDNKKIDYYINGKHLGTAFVNVIGGKNIAYFPGVSMGKKEKCVFNFGQLSFKYKYHGYEPLDRPLCRKNGNYEVIREILNLIKQNILLNFNNKNVGVNERMMMLYKLVKYLVFNAFNDIYILKILLIPFLCEIAHKKEDEFKKLWDIILIVLYNNEENENKFIDIFIENLTSFIEEVSLVGKNGIFEWKMFLFLFKSILKVDKIAIIWLSLQSAPNHLKNVFNSNCIHQGHFFEFIDSKYDIYKSNVTIFQVLQELEKQEKIKAPPEIERIYANELSNLIELFLTDQRIFHNNKKLKDVLNELIKQGFNQENQNDFLSIFDAEQFINRSENIFYKNICYNLINLLNKVYLNIPFDKISTEPWFNRKNNDSIYYDEVGVGGTISHVTTEYISMIDPSLIIKSTDTFIDYFHKAIRLCGDLLMNSILKNFNRNRKQFKKTKISSLKISENGSENLDFSIRKHFYLFSFNAQEIFYQFSFMLIKYLIWLKNKNFAIIYFIPIFFVDLPFRLFKTLYKLSSPIFCSSTMRKEINKTSIHFKNDDYFKCILNFYLFLFSDETICNPELKNSLSEMVNFFTKKKWLVLELQKDTESFDFLIKGLINNMKSVSLSQDACKILIKIISPICFGNTMERKTIDFVPKLDFYFKTNKKLLNVFFTCYFTLLNQEMTRFIQGVSESIDNHSLSNDGLIALLQNTSISFNFMCTLLKISEFFLMFFPDELLNLSLYSLYFISLLKNLSTRILAKPYITNLQKIAKKISEINDDSNENKVLTQKNKINLLSLAFSICGIFWNISKANNTKYFRTFMNKIEESSEFVIDSFIEFNTLFNFKEINKEMKFKICEYFNFLKEIKKNKIQKNLTQEEINKLSEEDKICILCCDNLKDTHILPCKHMACNDCLVQYRAEKDTCFFCHGKIESIERIEIKK